MSDENEAGAAYLSALRKSTGQATGAAPARTPPSLPHNPDGAGLPAKSEANSSEKRRSPRYRCQGSAHLRDVGTGVATWATFTDISLNGCYVEAMSTFRVGARLALTIELNGFRVETNGEVRVVYPSLGMGVSFNINSDESRERLRELLRSLSRPSVILTPRPKVNDSVPPNSLSLSPIQNPAAAMKAVAEFFADRHILTRDEFFRIVKRSQSSGS